MRFRAISCALIALAAGSAQAAFFSFASGSAGNAWTFNGNGLTITDGTGTNPITLLIDDNNGPLATLNVSSTFDANIILAYAGSTNLGGGNFAHNYTAQGTFSFTDMVSGTPLLNVAFTGALFTAQGGQNSWYSTAALQGNPSGGATVTMNWTGANLPGYNLAPGSLVNQSFAFDFSALNTSGALPYGGQSPGTPLTANFVPTGTWFSEASFSAAGNIPAPGALALLGLGTLVATRRRR
jgi:MYXO-CTERM domain-containing protein